MGEHLTPEQFESTLGIAGWRASDAGATARFRTRTFSAGARFIAAIAEQADAIDHHPDVDLRFRHVTVTTVSHDVGALTGRDVKLARRISEIADDHGIAIETETA